jgi:maltose O-acetyltransferase
MSEKDRMLAGRLYLPFDEELGRDNKKARMLTRLFNSSTEEQQDYRKILLKQLFKSTGDNIYIEPPFRTDYGCNTSIGENFYANYDCIIIDVCSVTIGRNVFFAPRVCIYTAAHPIDAAVRNSLLEFGNPVCIGDDVWVGGNVVVNPGVKIGSNVVIGSGSVVVKDIPDGVIAAGSPAKVIREITPHDREKWMTLAAQYHKETQSAQKEQIG